MVGRGLDVVTGVVSPLDTCVVGNSPPPRTDWGPLTLKFDRATLPFLKIDLRHEAYRHGKT